MLKFYSLTVKDITQETADCVSIAFEIPQELKQEFSYLQGQYITFRLNIDGKELRRSYSLCSSALTDADVRVAVKMVKGGLGSTFLNKQVRVGDKLEVMSPRGNFHTPIDANHQKEYILFAGGSGITPMMSIIKTVLKAEPKSNIQLFYGNESESSIIFHKHLNQLELESEGRLKVHHIINQAPVNFPELNKGILTQEKVTTLMSYFVNTQEQTEFFICGPTPMMKNVEETLKILNIPKNQIHIEYFKAPSDNVAHPVIAEEAPNATLTIILDGDRIVTQMLPDETVLEAALRLNLDAPYACQGGSCCTCRALLEEGEVKMTVNYALLDEEVKQGYILTCQSHPVTGNLVVNYDKAN